MKVLLLNGSPREKGCTNAALHIISDELNTLGISTEQYNIGTAPISGCRACHSCLNLGKCVIDDRVNLFCEKAREADGFVFGSPVHYASPSGAVLSFLDRCFFSASGAFRGKPAASVVSCRRGGATAAFDVLNKYASISSMPIVTSTYWNMVHGSVAEDVVRDAEGAATMTNLARNMAWLLFSVEAGKKAGILSPIPISVKTNFVRDDL